MSRTNTTTSLAFREWTYAEAWEKRRKTRTAAGTASHAKQEAVDTSQCIQALEWSNDQNYLWACTRAGEVCLWKVSSLKSDDKTIGMIPPPQQTEPVWRYHLTPKGTLKGMRLTPNKQHLVLAGTDGLWILDINEILSTDSYATKDNHVRRFSTHPNAWTSPTATEICFIRSNNHAVFGVAENDDFGIYQWDISTQKIVNTISPSGRGVRITSIDAGGNHQSDNTEDSLICAAGDSQGVIRLWNTSTGSVQATLYSEQVAPIQFVRMVSKGWLVAAHERLNSDRSGGTTSTRVVSELVTWHIATQSIVARTTVPAKIQTMVVVDEDDKIWVGLNDGQVHVFTALDLQLERRTNVSTTPSVHAIAVSTSCVAAAGVGRTVEIWDTDCLPYQRLTL
jgi:WD40 repeat protein